MKNHKLTAGQAKHRFEVGDLVVLESRARLYIAKKTMDRGAPSYSLGIKKGSIDIIGIDEGFIIGYAYTKWRTPIQ